MYEYIPLWGYPLGWGGPLVEHMCYGFSRDYLYELRM